MVSEGVESLSSFFSLTDTSAGSPARSRPSASASSERMLLMSAASVATSSSTILRAVPSLILHSDPSALIFPDFNNEMRFERMPPDLRNNVISMRLILCCPNTSGAVPGAAARQLLHIPLTDLTASGLAGCAASFMSVHYCDLLAVQALLRRPLAGNRPAGAMRWPL